MSMGPVQIIVVAYGADAEFHGDALAELQRLADADVVRLLDLLIVNKAEDGGVTVVDIEEGDDFGLHVKALIGIGPDGDDGAEPPAADLDPEEMWVVTDEIPPGTAAIALIEHRWAIGLRDAVVGSGGVMVANEWVHPLDLEAIGVTAD